MLESAYQAVRHPALGVILAFCGLYLRVTAFFPEYVHLLLEFVGIAQVIITLPWSFSAMQANLQKLFKESRIYQDLIGADVLESSPALADALRRFVLGVLAHHEFGNVPVKEDLISEITASDLQERQRSLFHVERSREQATIQWVVFRIREQWTERVPRGRKLDPLEGLMLFVLDREAYEVLWRFHLLTRRLALFHPISRGVLLRYPSLRDVVYLHEPAAEDEKWRVVKRRSADHGVVEESKVRLTKITEPLEQLWGRTLQGWQGLERVDKRNVLHGTIQAYQPEYAEGEISISPSESSYEASIRFGIDYIIPVRIYDNDRRLRRDLTIYSYPFRTVTSVKQIGFRTSDSGLVFDEDMEPLVMTALGELGCRLDGGNTWSVFVKEGSKIAWAYPGERIVFRYGHVKP
jgi:hypothetical protein